MLLKQLKAAMIYGQFCHDFEKRRIYEGKKFLLHFSFTLQ